MYLLTPLAIICCIAGFSATYFLIIVYCEKQPTFRTSVPVISEAAGVGMTHWYDETDILPPREKATRHRTVHCGVLPYVRKGRPSIYGAVDVYCHCLLLVS